jgi:hypothetical protein
MRFSLFSTETTEVVSVRELSVGDEIKVLGYFVKIETIEIAKGGSAKVSYDLGHVNLWTRSIGRKAERVTSK